MALPTQDHIFVRSPFIIQVDDPTQTGSKVELFIYKFGSTPPATPTYTLSKLIPASNDTRTLYNLSPYVREYITHPTSPDNINTDLLATPVAEYALIDVYTYNLIAGTYVLQFTETYRAFDGYGDYETGINPDYSIGRFVALTEPNKTYYYYYDFGTYPTTSESLSGTLTAYLPKDYVVVYIDLVTTLSYSFTALSAGVYDLYRVPTSMIGNGAELTIYTPLSVPVFTCNFRPVEECKYEPIVLDFINKYGGWQRETFFKASFESLEVQSTPYNFMQSFDSSMTYDVRQGQKQIFNNNGGIKYKINSGWVEEDFSENLQELLLSERVLWTKGNTKLPIRINTKSINKEKNINNKKINYSLDFEMAFDVINNVI
jgi:hypothetical protein